SEYNKYIQQNSSEKKLIQQKLEHILIKPHDLRKQEKIIQKLLKLIVGEGLPLILIERKWFREFGIITANSLIKKAKALIDFFESNKQLERLKEAQQSLHRDTIYEIIHDVDTRWNSTFYALHRLYILKLPIQWLANTLSYDAKFNVRNDATALLGGSNYVTLSAMFPIIQRLIYNLRNNYSNIDDTTIQAVRNAILTDMEKRWGTSPRYAIMSERLEIIEDLRQEYQQLSSTSTNQPIQLQRNLQQEDDILIENDFNEFIIQQKSKPNMASFFKSSMTQDPVITSEFDNYLFIPE
ncbi:8388_t:CDS:2, partial [Cetraspora pellucida]